VIFDHSATTFRNAIYDDYKANRPELPEDLRPQFPLTREATRAFNVACIETEGYEADDIIAALVAVSAVEAGGKLHHHLVGQGPDAADPPRGGHVRPDEDPGSSAPTR
jgi:DNA polymerase I